MMTALMVLAILFTLLAQAHPSVAQRPDAPAYAKRGKYIVGTRELRIDHPTRPLDVAVWYPATNPERKKVEATYRFLALSGTGQALRDAPADLSGGPYPLVVFSHGLSGAKYQSIFYVEHLASYGFVVIAADHPGSTFGTITAESVQESFALRPLEVLRQIAFAETLTAADGLLAGAIDMAAIGVTGHSFGGYTSIAVGGARFDFSLMREKCTPQLSQAERREANCATLEAADALATLRGLSETPQGVWPATSHPNIKAIVLLAPSSAPAFGKAGLAAVTAPTMIIVGSKDGATVPERDAYPMYQGISSTAKAQVVLENADHYIFVDECIPALILLGQYRRCSDSVWDMARAHDLTNHFATAFLLRTLRDDTTAGAALDPSKVAFTGVNYQAVYP
jgi:predicted dienelactone hydrolase